MKRILSFALVFVLCLSLCACGGNSDAPDVTDAPDVADAPDTTIQYAKVGDTVASNRVEFVLERVDFSKYLYTNTLANNENFLKPISESELANLADGEKYGTAEDGKVFVSLSFSIENIGKTKLRDFVELPDGTSTINMYGYVELDYDGFKFRDDDISAFFIKGSTSWMPALLEMEVMAPSENFVGYIAVPEKVMTDTETPLYLHIYLPNDAGEFEAYTYQIR